MSRYCLRACLGLFVLVGCALIFVGASRHASEPPRRPVIPPRAPIQFHLIPRMQPAPPLPK